MDNHQLVNKISALREKLNAAILAIPDMAVCTNMNLITPEKVLRFMEEMKPVIKVPEEIRIRARKAADRMLAVGTS